MKSQLYWTITFDCVFKTKADQPGCGPRGLPAPFPPSSTLAAPPDRAFMVEMLVFGVSYLVLGVWCLVSGVLCQVSGAWCLVPGVWSLVWCLVWCLVSGVWCLVFDV